MTRMCVDCGIAPWQDCQCDPHAGLGAPANPYQERERLSGTWAMVKPESVEHSDPTAAA